MTYSFKTPYGTFRIRPHRTNPQRVELWLGSECLGSYGNAFLAASDVYDHATGDSGWDMSSLPAPDSLGEWEKG